MDYFTSVSKIQDSICVLKGLLELSNLFESKSRFQINTYSNWTYVVLKTKFNLYNVFPFV